MDEILLVAEEEMEKAYRLLFENNLMNKEHTFNLKYELSDYFIKRALKDGINLSVKTNMFAYDCPNTIKPDEIRRTEEIGTGTGSCEAGAYRRMGNADVTVCAGNRLEFGGD